MTRSKILHDILQDNLVMGYLLKQEHLIVKYFNIPLNTSPKCFIMELANASATDFEYPQYHVSPINANLMTVCTLCNSTLRIKKTVDTLFFDDVLGTQNLCIISKYCSNCKVTVYPTYQENYQEKKRLYMEDWRRYGLFMSTAHTSFSLDFMERTVCLKLRCHTSFIGRSDAYNYQWGYKKSNKNKMDKRILAESYYKYSLLCFKERYNLPLFIDLDVTLTLKEELPELLAVFMARASSHECEITGCKSCVVIDGHMKAHRKICFYKNCIEDPMTKSKYCEVHNQTGDIRGIINDAQVLNDGNEFHIEKIVKSVKIKKRRCYEVSWVGYNEITVEPRENIPRVLTELYDLYGNSSIPTTIKKHFEQSGIKYVSLGVENQDDLVLPACSMEINENAYYIPLPKTKDSCDTEKTKSRFYHRTGGILAYGRPCGHILGLAEIYRGESIHQVAELIEGFLENQKDPSKTTSLLYDDGCHLKRAVMKKKALYPLLFQKEIKIDRFHFKNHKEKWCKDNMDPDKSIHLKGVNTEVMEQAFAWLKGYAPSLRYMNRVTYLFILIDLIDRRNLTLLDFE